MGIQKSLLSRLALEKIQATGECLPSTMCPTAWNTSCRETDVHAASQFWIWFKVYLNLNWEIHFVSSSALYLLYERVFHWTQSSFLFAVNKEWSSVDPPTEGMTNDTVQRERSGIINGIINNVILSFPFNRPGPSGVPFRICTTVNYVFLRSSYYYY